MWRDLQKMLTLTLDLSSSFGAWDKSRLPKGNYEKSDFITICSILRLSLFYFLYDSRQEVPRRFARQSHRQRLIRNGHDDLTMREEIHLFPTRAP